MIARKRYLQRLKRVFGPTRLPAPLKPAKLEAIEAELGSPLPDSLRSFVLEVANGGPGPDCTLWPLATGLKNLAELRDASRRFPLSQKRIAVLVSEKQTDGEAIDYDEESPHPLRGVIPIADAGCNLMFAVVSKGKSAGTVWLVGEGWAPLLDEGGIPIRFDAWIHEWLARVDPEGEAPEASTPRRSLGDATKIDASWAKPLKRALEKAASTTSLSLSTMDWSKDFEAVLPDVFDRLPNLKSLSIAGNFTLRHLPPSVARLERLKKLWLVEVRQLQEIEVVGELESLEFLNISRSRGIKSLPASVGRLPKLRSLLAMFSGLKTLPESFSDASQLSEVWLHESFELDMRLAWPVLASMPALTTLKLDDSRLLTWPDELAVPAKLQEISLVRCELPAGLLERSRSVMPNVTFVTESNA